MREPKRHQRRVDVTLPLDESIRLPRTSWTVHSTRLTEDGLQQLSHLSISPHSLTHMDILPFGHATSGTGRERVPSAEEGVRAQPLQRPEMPRSRECIILNITDRLPWMENALREAMARCGEEWRLPFRPVELWMPQQYELILKALVVREDEIVAKLDAAGIDALDNTCIVLYTGWRTFSPLYQDCGNPCWWAWHPFLLHPYLEVRAAMWLRKKGACGIGTDAISVDSPLRHWLRSRHEGFQAPWKCIRDMVSAIPMDSVGEESGRRYAPVHEVFLSEGGFLLESLNLTSEILSLQDETSVPRLGDKGVDLPSAARARITILPYRVGNRADALLVYVFMVPPGGK